MNQAIVICTTPKFSPFLVNLLNSLSGYDRYPLLIVSNYGYELGKIKFVMEHTDIDEFLLLHESVEIKNFMLFNLVFEHHMGKSVSLAGSPDPIGSYLGKYRREVLQKMAIPTVSTKAESVDYEERFNREYNKIDPVVYIEPKLHNSNTFVEKFGRRNMVLENQYLIKYKGAWSRDMVG